MKTKIEYQPIGVIHTPFKKLKGMPIQPSGADGVHGTVEVFKDFAVGLQDLEGFSHIMLLYHFHRSTESSLIVTPFMDSQPHGVFATRAPKRPNPIGFSIVRLLGREENILNVENVPEFDHHPTDRLGWLEQAKGKVQNKRSDDRFR